MSQVQNYAEITTLNDVDLFDMTIYSPDGGGIWTTMKMTKANMRKALNGFSEYGANLNQTGTDAPVAAAEYGDITGPAYARVSSGRFTITKVGAFGAGTSVVFSGCYGFPYIVSITNDVITFETYRVNASIGDDVLENVGVIIRVKNP